MGAKYPHYGADDIQIAKFMRAFYAVVLLDAKCIEENPWRSLVEYESEASKSTAQKIIQISPYEDTPIPGTPPSTSRALLI